MSWSVLDSEGRITPAKHILTNAPFSIKTEVTLLRNLCLLSSGGHADLLITPLLTESDGCFGLQASLNLTNAFRLFISSANDKFTLRKGTFPNYTTTIITLEHGYVMSKSNLISKINDALNTASITDLIVSEFDGVSLPENLLYLLWKTNSSSSIYMIIPENIPSAVTLGIYTYVQNSATEFYSFQISTALPNPSDGNFGVSTSHVILSYTPKLYTWDYPGSAGVDGLVILTKGAKSFVLNSRPDPYIFHGSRSIFKSNGAEFIINATSASSQTIVNFSEDSIDYNDAEFSIDNDNFFSLPFVITGDIYTNYIIFVKRDNIVKKYSIVAEGTTRYFSGENFSSSILSNIFNNEDFDIQVWGAGGGNTPNKYGGSASYVNMNVNSSSLLKTLCIWVGQKGSLITSSTSSGGSQSRIDLGNVVLCQVGGGGGASLYSEGGFGGGPDPNINISSGSNFKYDGHKAESDLGGFGSSGDGTATLIQTLSSNFSSNKLNLGKGGRGGEGFGGQFGMTSRGSDGTRTRELSGGGGGGATGVRNIGTFQNVTINTLNIRGPFRSNINTLGPDRSNLNRPNGGSGMVSGLSVCDNNKLYNCNQYNLLSIYASTLSPVQNNEIVTDLLSQMCESTLDNATNIHCSATFGENYELGMIEDKIVFNATEDSSGSELCIQNEGQMTENLVGVYISNGIERRKILSVRTGLSPSKRYNAIYFKLDSAFSFQGPYQYESNFFMNSAASSSSKGVTFYNKTDSLSVIAPQECVQFENNLYTLLSKLRFFLPNSALSPIPQVFPEGKNALPPVLRNVNRINQAARFFRTQAYYMYGATEMNFDIGDYVNVMGLTGDLIPFNFVAGMFKKIIGKGDFNSHLPSSNWPFTHNYYFIVQCDDGDDFFYDGTVTLSSGSAKIQSSNAFDYLRLIYPSRNSTSSYITANIAVKPLSAGLNSQFIGNYMTEYFEGAGEYTFAVPTWTKRIDCYVYGAGGTSLTTENASNGSFVSDSFVNLSGGSLVIKVGYRGGVANVNPSEIYGGGYSGISYGGGCSSVQYKNKKIIAGGGGGRGLGKKIGLHGYSSTFRGEDGHGGAGGSGLRGGQSSSGLGGNGSSQGRLSRQIQNQKYFHQLNFPGTGGSLSGSNPRNGGIALEIYP